MPDGHFLYLRKNIRKQGEKRVREDKTFSNKYIDRVRGKSNSWWLIAGAVDDSKNSGLVSIEFNKKYQDYSKLRKVVWNLYRAHAGRTDLSPVSKLLLWSVCERYRWETWSSHDAVSYYSKMIGVHRTSAGRAMSELLEKEILWCVLEDEKKRLMKSQSAGRKHYLLVGLGALLE